MPSLVVLALMLVLVLLWPHKWRHVAHPNSMPEATASYVLVEGSYAALPGNPLGDPWPGPRGSTLPEREDVVVRRLPAPEYTGLGVSAPWLPLPRRAQSNALPNLADRPVAEVLTGLPSATNRLVTTLSPGLQRSGFHFEVPPEVMTGMLVARFHVELDEQGEVVHVLSEQNDNPTSLRLLESALGRGRGTRAGSGEVVVSWGR